MVSVEVKAGYWQALRAVSLVSFFIDFLDGELVRPTSVPDPAEAESMVEHLLACVRDGDRESATGLYERLSARRLQSESELVHDDFLVFAVVCTVRKFQLDDQWIRNLLRLRPAHEPHQQMLTKSFGNLLAGDYNAREDYHQVSVAFQLVVGQYQPDAVRLHKMVAFLWRNPFPWFDSEFLTIISMRAIRAAFEVKGLLNPEQRFETEEFVSRFKQQVTLLSEVVSWTVFVAAVGGLAGLALFYAEDPKGKTILGTLAAFGLGLGTLTDLRKWGANQIGSFLKKLMGYKPTREPVQEPKKQN